MALLVLLQFVSAANALANPADQTSLEAHGSFHAAVSHKLPAHPGSDKTTDADNGELDSSWPGLPALQTWSTAARAITTFFDELNDYPAQPAFYTPRLRAPPATILCS
ncbi:MAG: hypothetical protein ACN2B6_12770 [Rickettsiales bacterium]